MTVTESYESQSVVTKAEAATALKVSIRTVDRYIADGTLESIRLSARATRITRESLDRLLKTPASSDVTPTPSGGAATSVRRAS